MLNNIEIAWLAGILEGEGYFGFNGSSKSLNPSIQVSMVDRDIIERIADLFAAVKGKKCNIMEIDRFTKINSNWQTQYKVEISGKPARKIMLLVVKLMGFRRRQKIWQILNGYKTIQKADRVELMSLLEGLNTEHPQ
jgi:hypothetical protein